MCRVSQEAGDLGEPMIFVFVCFVFSSSLAGSLEDVGELMFQFEYEGRKKPMSLFKGNQAERILSYSGKFQPFILFALSTD